MHLTGIDFQFWAAGFVLHLLLLGVLLRRHRATSFPFFTALIGSDALRTAILFTIVHKGDKHSYLIGYLMMGSIDLGLQLGVVYEIASHVFRPLGKWTPDSRPAVFWISSISLATAAGLTWISPLPPGRTFLMTVLVRGDFFSAVLLSELFVGMIALSVTIHLPWKTHCAKIAQGLGFYSLICIVIEAGHSYLGIDHSKTISLHLSYMRILTYLIVEGYWIVMLWFEAPAPKELSAGMRRQLLALRIKLELDLGRLRNWRE
jgi:hypothetical protein